MRARIDDLADYEIIRLLTFCWLILLSHSTSVFYAFNLTLKDITNYRYEATSAEIKPVATIDCENKIFIVWVQDHHLYIQVYLLTYKIGS